MASQALRNLAKILTMKMSRRTAIRRLGEGIVGGVLAQAGVTHVGFQPRPEPVCIRDAMWENYTKTQLLPSYRVCSPNSLAGVAALVREAEAAHKRVHALGSGWSLSDCAHTNDYLIGTKAFDRPIQTIRHALRPHLTSEASTFYHVEAGITIKTLYKNLDHLRLALPTMGAASGQTIAGAISTGTHGGDKLIAPLADSVVAIHLIGPSGAQFWLEPSSGITDPGLLKAHVVPDIDPLNIIYNDVVFDACLVSLGCMGIIYAVVLKVRPAYSLMEKIVETTWRDFRANISSYLNTPDRFLQVMVNPYTENDDNLCLIITRREVEPDPFVDARVRPSGDGMMALANMFRDMGPDVERGAHHAAVLAAVFHNYDKEPREQQLAKAVQWVLTNHPDKRHVMVAHYKNILRTAFLPGEFRAPSYVVMDLGYTEPGHPSNPACSIELSFDATSTYRRPGFVDFVNEVIARVNGASHTFFAGYIALRFTGPTRAYLGMQQWKQTCAVEVSVVQGVHRLCELLSGMLPSEGLATRGVELGGLPHWGQQLDMPLQLQHANMYRQYGRWRQAYAKMSNNFTVRTFENALSSRWNLTTPNDAQFVAQKHQGRPLLPEAMQGGQTLPVTVEMYNSGVSTWTRAGSYRLGSQAPQDNTVWGLSRVDLPNDVMPGKTATFQFNITAPSQSGIYQFQWRMVQDSVEWFGRFTSAVAIRVSIPGACQRIAGEIEGLEEEIRNLQEQRKQAPTNQKGAFTAEIEERQGKIRELRAEAQQLGCPP
jgi:hypothetical protein